MRSCGILLNLVIYHRLDILPFSTLASQGIAKPKSNTTTTNNNNYNDNSDINDNTDNNDNYNNNETKQSKITTKTITFNNLRIRDQGEPLVE